MPRTMLICPTRRPCRNKANRRNIVQDVSADKTLGE